MSPAISIKQRRLFGVALAIKRGKVPRSYSRQARKMSDEMSEEQLEEFAGSVKKKSRKRS